jgi:hypothetical protein
MSEPNSGQHSHHHWYSNNIDIVTVIVDCLKASSFHHRLRWVKAHHNEKIPYADLDLWGQLNCDADKLAERFWKLMGDGVIKPMKEGFFTDSMDVGISVDSIEGTSHLLHQFCLNIQWRKH